MLKKYNYPSSFMNKYIGKQKNVIRKNITNNTSDTQKIRKRRELVVHFTYHNYHKF